MKRVLTLNGRRCEIEIVAPPPACQFEFDGASSRSADVVAPAQDVYSILIEGRSYEAAVEETPTGMIVSVEGYRFEIAIHDPRRWSRQSAEQGGEGVQTIASPMPGKIVRVLVAPGDTVEPGQGVIVVEAMKMQNEMKAGRAGTVVTVTAKPGATVAAGEVLATIG